MDETKETIYPSGQISIRLNDERRKLLSSHYQQIAGFTPDENNLPLSGIELFDRLMAMAVKNITSEESVNQLNSRISLLETDNANLENRLSEVETEKERLLSGNFEGENIVVLPLNPAISDIVDQCIQRANAKTGKRFSRQDIFLNLFWEAVKSGRASLPIIFSTSEVIAILKKYQLVS